ncbi:DUF3054 domain-containing protein [Ilumatobacter sp.]|uniref:DUF3054 domain-containing protein n=1 Tax=Ilumatobacter sp. TaxID=1967498 RepID=UPI003AF5C2F9
MRPENRLAVAVGLDTFVVVLFVALGLRTHEQESAYAAVLETAAPFLIGLGVAWLVARAWRRPTAILTGLVIWPVTVLLGMAVRRGLFDRGTATSFVVVATLFLGAFLVGWRIAWRLVDQRRRRQSSGGALIAK